MGKQDTEEIYVKRWHVIENVEAVWYDFYALGAERTEKIHNQNYGHFIKKEDAVKRGEKLKKSREQELKELGKEGLIKKLGLSFPVTATLRSSVPPYDERVYEASTFEFFYDVSSVFESAGFI
jgi:hypothetical protein